MKIATDMVQKPVEIRNELSSTLKSANYIALAGDGEEGDGTDGSSEEDIDTSMEDASDVTSRVASHSGIRITKSTQTAAVETSGVGSGSKVSQLIRSSGGSLF